MCLIFGMLKEMNGLRSECGSLKKKKTKQNEKKYKNKKNLHILDLHI